MASDGSLKAHVAAPPVDGEANAAVCELVAKALGVAKSRVSVRSGHSSRDKILEIEGMDDGELRDKLGAIGGQKRLPGT